MMSTEPVASAPAEHPAKQTSAHPLAPLLAGEISAAADLTRTLWPVETSLWFKAITLEEPAKTDVVPFLEAEHSDAPTPHIDRKAFVNYYLRNTNKFHEAIVNLTTRHVERNVRLGPNVHANGDGDEIIALEKIALEDEGVRAEIAKLQLPEGSVVISDPWIYGADGIDDDERMFQCFLYMRDPYNANEGDSNHYALPLAISPVISTEHMKVIRIDRLPLGADNTLEETTPYKIKPPNEYLPEYQQLRTDLKPLNVVQPEGASFTVAESRNLSTLEWQKWSFRVGFNQREGIVLYDVRYDGRSLFYRVSLSDMNIPYADPRHPFHKKAAFDLGDAGAGCMANNLKLGCDCLGSIYYLSAVLSNAKGGVDSMENCVCIHEQDAGISWKHTNYRTNRAAIARSRELVVQSIITVSNYEYILAFIFNQAGQMDYEVRATGILSTQPINEGISMPFGTVVHPGVFAAHHQHIFSLRVDPAIDGHSNRIVYDEAHAMPRSDFNPHGTGYYVEETILSKSGGYDLDYDRNRVFKIQNATHLNPINGKPVAYKIQVPGFQKMLADRDSFHHRRGEFADHNIYVTRYRDGELYAGGKYTNQSRGGTGVRSWASRNDDIVDTDLVVFVQFGMNHIVRIEDFPVMPAEIMRVCFKPVNFFVANPALDVPPSEQRVNQSSLLNGHGAAAVETGRSGECCDAVEEGGKSRL